MDDVDLVFRALADPTRRALLDELFARDGLVNTLLWEGFGIQGPSWVSHPDYSLWTLIILSIWQFGSPMIIFLAGLRQIPTDMYEAASLDGASTLGGRSGTLGDPQDQRLMSVLRSHADVVLVGSGTVEAEGYGGAAVDEADAAWRVSRGMPAQPRFAVVSWSIGDRVLPYLQGRLRSIGFELQQRRTFGSVVVTEFERA